MSSTGEVVLGVVLGTISAILLAFSMSVQRYALTTPPPVPFLFGYKLGQFWVWLFGFLIYVVANLIFAFSLNYAPFALLGALFTTLLVWNLFFGCLILHEGVTVNKSTGALCIFVGVVFIGIAAPSVPNDYSVSLVERYLNDGVFYLCSLLTILIICVIGIFVFEHIYPLPEPEEASMEFELNEPAETVPVLASSLTSKSSAKKSKHRLTRSCTMTSIPSSFISRSRTMTSIASSIKKKNTRYITQTLMRNNGYYTSSLSGMLEISIEHRLQRNEKTPPWLDKLMGVVYPASLGLDEGIGHLALKAFMALWRSCGDNNNECGAAIFWVMLMTFVVSSLGTLWWLPTVFRRYDVTQALPIEYGTVIICDTLSAIIFYKEADYMEDSQVFLTLAGLVVIILGILVGRNKPRAG